VRKNVEILAPTWLEYRATRRTLPQAQISRTGISLARWRGANRGASVIVCGLAGALAPELPAGTILVPSWVGLADGTQMQCDPLLVEMLTTAACNLRLPLDTGPMLTARTLVVGDERQRWFQQGFVAADMETGLLAGRNLRVATVRVVLDTPARELPPDLARSTRALFQPLFWRELLWLSHAAPRYARLAARVLKAGLDPG
jgi:hypothetical protein